MGGRVGMILYKLSFEFVSSLWYCYLELSLLLEMTQQGDGVWGRGIGGWVVGSGAFMLAN